MTLRRKTLVLVGATTVGLVAILNVTSRDILLRSLRELEEVSVLRDVGRGKRALANDVSNLEVKSQDWARWDDTYNFMEDLDPAYVTSNLQDPTFSDLRINLITFVDPGGSIVWSKAFDLKAQESAEPPDALRCGRTVPAGLRQHEEGSTGVAGVLPLAEGLMLVTAKPIVRSDGEGPPRGTMMMGRWLDEAKIAGLGEVAGLALEIRTLGGEELPGDFQAARTVLEGGRKTHARLLGRDEIAGYCLIKDLNDRAVAMMRVAAPRDIFRRGEAGVRYLVLALLITGLAFGVVTVVVVERVVVSRVARLAAEVKRVGTSGDLSARVNAEGADELSELAGAINGTLTAIERSEHAVSESRRMLYTLMSNLPGMAYRCRNDRAWTMEFVSEGSRELTGYEPADLVQSRAVTYADLVHPEDRDEVWSKVQIALEERRSFQVSYRLRAAGGAEKWVWEQGRGVFAETGELLALEGLVCDMTDRQRAEERLRLTQFSVDQAPEVVLWIDENARMIYVNDAAVRHTGYSREELLTMTVQDIAPDFAVAAWAEHWRALREVGEIHLEGQHRRKDGSTPQVEITTTYQEYDGRGYGFVYIRDVTERKEREAAHRRMALAVQAAGDAVMITNDRGQIIHVNPAFEALTGYAVAEVLGRSPRLLRSEVQAEAVYEEMRRKIQTGQIWQGRITNRRKDGTDYTAAMTVAPILDERYALSGYVSVQRDVTEEMMQERRLREQALALRAANMGLEVQWQQLEAQQQQVVALNEELVRASSLAEAANRSKSEFLANMSHEIRTPMTAICGFAEILEDDIACCTVCAAHADCAVRRRNAEHVATIRRNGHYLLELINDILDLSKVEAGKLSLEQMRCNPLQIAADVRQLMQSRAASKGLYLEVESAGLAPETIVSDPTRLRQALINLVGNAVKFTEHGGVRVIVALATAAEAANPRLQFDIVDTGIGISAEQIPGLFQAFSQADSSMTRRYGGTGLGLALSKRLAELLGGGLELVASAPGGGTTFRLTVATGSLEGVAMVGGAGPAAPVAPVATEAPKAAEGVSLSGCRVLLAEDGLDNQRLLSMVLRKAGAEVAVAPDGRAAMEQALAAREEGRPFEVILMDMQMPVMDGFSATSLLRQRGYAGPIIALTAHAMASDRDKCLAAGCDDYASKPIDRGKLIAMIERYRQPARAGIGESPAGGAGAAGGG